MTADKRIHRYAVRFEARLIDERRLRSVLAHHFGATAIDVAAKPLGITRVLRGAKKGRPPRAGSVAARVLEFLGDEKPHRLSSMIEIIQAKRGAVARAAADLVNAGTVKRVVHGCYSLPHVSTEIVPIAVHRRLGPGLQRAYDLLKTPRTAVQLRDLLGVTRQAVEQTMKKLIARGLVRRTESIGEHGSHIYMRADQRPVEVLAARIPTLRPTAAKALSSIPVDAPVTLTTLISALGRTPASRAAVQELRQFGLVDISGQGHSRLVQLTTKGREHPQFEVAATKLTPVGKTGALDKPPMSILRVIQALGSVRSLEITLLTGIGRGRHGHGAGTGNYVARLLHRGLIEPAASKAKGHPAYRLTKPGLAYMASLRGQIEFLDPEETRSRLLQEHETYVQEQRTRSRRHLHGGLGLGSARPPTAGRLADIVETLQRTGPLPTTGINGFLPRPYDNARSLNLSLRVLAARGEVTALNTHGRHKAIVWAAAPAPKSSNAMQSSAAGEEAGAAPLDSDPTPIDPDLRADD